MCVRLWLTAIKRRKTSQMLYQISHAWLSPAGICDKYTWEVQLQSFHLICERRCGCAGICNRARRPNKLVLKAYAGVNPTVPLSLPVSPPAISLHTSIILICVLHTLLAPGTTLGRSPSLRSYSHKAGRERVVWGKLGCVGTRAECHVMCHGCHVTTYKL